MFHLVINFGIVEPEIGLRLEPEKPALAHSPHLSGCDDALNECRFEFLAGVRLDLDAVADD